MLEQQAVDKKKKELALGNGIEKYIEIDCSSVEKQIVIKRILAKLCKKKEINYKPKAIKKKVFRYDLFGNLLGVYCSVRNAAIEANNTEQGVSLCCRNKNKTSKKEIFSFEELTKKQIEERLQND